jgi:hypothetical protein
VDDYDALYYWSDFGSDIDLAAAGCLTTTNLGGGYAGWCGTSFSSPTVAGVAGLIYSKNPSLTGYQVRDILKSNTNDIYTPGYDIYSGFGTPNMAKAVNAAGNGPVPDTSAPSSPTLSVTGATATQVNLSWSASNDNVGVVGYNILRNGTKIASASGTSYSDKTVSSGSTYSYTVSAYDLAGNTSSPSNVVGVTTPVQVVSVAIVTKQVSAKTTTTATITWTTNINSKGSVSYGSSSNSLTGTATDSVDGLTHSVTISGLSKFTNYYYKITATSSDGTSTVTSVVTSFKTDKR